MSPPAQEPFVPLERYLEDEELSANKHEYCNGTVVTMAGGTMAHARVVTNLGGILFAALKGKPCRPFNDAQRIVVRETGLWTYPDHSVICGAPQRDDRDRHGATNPKVLFEVLSESTAGYDQGEKFDHYATIPSLEAYVLVDSRRANVVLNTRADNGWLRRVYSAPDTLRIDAIDVQLVVAELYEGWAELV